jgi:putative ABC transport system permease protein
MAARELLRQPRSFLVPVAILGLLALLLLYPSSILDGIVAETTSGMRNAPADLILYSKQANGVMARSEIDAATRARVDAVPGTTKVATFEVLPFGATIEGRAEPLGLALTASNQALGSAKAPAPGEGVADVSLRTRQGLTEGTKLLVGPYQVPITVVGFTSGTNLFFAGGMVVHPLTWLVALSGTKLAPEAVPAAATAANDGASQALLITVDKGIDPREVSTAVDRATEGKTQTFTRDAAVQAMPGIEQQENTFGYMRAITLIVALVVVALFLSFMTLERAPLYAALKAIGAASQQLYVALVAQVLLITAAAVAGAAFITFALTRLPTQLPTVMQPGRLVQATVALGTVAVLGSALSLRRVVNVDPADAIG